MKVKIKVGQNVKFPMGDFQMSEESGGIEIEVEAKDEEDLAKQIEHWQDYIHERVIKSAFKGANNFVKAKKLLMEDED
jgi:uncharacterized protein YggU (UPF0235/DUF167 family)